MKNVFVVLAFMLMSSLAFAGSGEKAELGSSADVKIENFVGVGEDVDVVNGDESLKVLDVAKESCTVKVKLTYTDPKGQSHTIEGTFTFEGQSCGDLIKSVIAK